MLSRSVVFGVSLFFVGGLAGNCLAAEVDKKIVQRITAALKECGAADLEIKTSKQDGSVHFAYRCREYVKHGRTRIDFQTRSRSCVAPSASGFQLKLTSTPKHSRGGGGAGSPLYGEFINRDPYCRNYLTTYSLKNGNVLEVDWTEGTKTEPAIFYRVRKELSAFGKESSGTNPEEDIEGGVRKLETTIQAVMKKNSLDVGCKKSGNLLVWKFKTRNFDVHPVDDNGVASPKPQVQTGPQLDGFIVRIRVGKPERPPIPGTHHATSSGYVRMTYWDQYHANYDGWTRQKGNFFGGDAVEFSQCAAPRFRLELLYRNQTDRKLLKAIVDGINEQFTAPDQF